MFRRRAAAAAQNSRAVFQKHSAPLGKFLRGHIVDRLSVYQPGQAGVGLDHHRQVGILQDLPQHGPQLPGTHRTVEADYIRS